MATTAIFDRLILDIGELKELLGITANNQDAYLTLLLSAAKRAADRYCNNPFWELNSELDSDDYMNWSGNAIGITGLDQDQDVLSSTVTSSRLANTVPSLWSDPRVEESIPDDVKLGVLEWIRMFMRGKPADVAREKIGDWQVDYAVFVSKPNRAVLIEDTFWKRYRLVPGT